MGAIGGPNVVEDGLVLAFDGANVKSFRGEPTVNLLNTDLTSWAKDNGSVVTILDELYDGNPIYRVTFPAGTLPRIRLNFNYTSGQTFTGHLYYRYVSGQNSGEALPGFFFRESGFGTGHSSTNFPITTEFSFRTITHTFSSSGTSMFLLYRSLSNTSTEIVMDFSMPQLEQKPSATPFVNGTRGTTVATGGGWADRSGNGNHGELVNGPTFSSGNLGSIVFDGVDDRVIGNLSTSIANNPFTLEAWIRNPSIFGNIVYISVGDENLTNSSIHIRLQSSTSIRFGMFSDDLNVTVPDMTDKWVHINCILDSNRLQSVYLNGILYGSRTSNNFYIGNTVFGIGHWNVTSPTQYMQGNISQVRIYNRALSAEEVLQNYNATKGRFGL